jgi:hypothetical protein
MLDKTQLENALAKVTYMPGWSLSIVEPDSIQGVMLFIHGYVPNAYDDNGEVELRIFTPIPTMFSELGFYTWVMSRLKAVVLHELCEWFRVDGKLFIDPHRPL